MSETPERHEFQAEVKQLLDLMIHSLYSNKDIFLRELISNASDALDKLRFEALTQRPSWPPDGRSWRSASRPTPTRARSTVSDNGIGMTPRRGRPATSARSPRSGTSEFLGRAAASAQAQAVPPELIGQFGVGFYSAFMVADRVDVVTRRAGEATATRWESTGDGAYTIEEAERDRRGHHRHAAPQARRRRARPRATTPGAPVLRDIVKRYSDFVAYPIQRIGEASRADGVNSMKAIWTRPQGRGHRGGVRASSTSTSRTTGTTR